jgi:hypothetical protein
VASTRGGEAARNGKKDILRSAKKGMQRVNFERLLPRPFTHRYLFFSGAFQEEQYILPNGQAIQVDFVPRHPPSFRNPDEGLHRTEADLLVLPLK